MDDKWKSMDDVVVKGVAGVCRSEFDADHDYDVCGLTFSTANKIDD